MSPWISDLYLRSQSDARLLSLTRDGQTRAFAILVERYGPGLLAHARRLSTGGNAEDVVQQTFLSAFSALTGGAQVGHLRGWLHAILRNAAGRAHRPLDVPLERFDVCGEPLEVMAERQAKARSVISALEDLPSRQRQALLGSSLQGLSRAELASALGVSEGAVRQLVHRARIAIRTAVTAVTPYPLARWLAASGAHTGAGPELAATAGAASAGGLMAKVGAFAAAGVIATGIAATQTHPSARQPRTHPAGSGHVRRTSSGQAVRVVTAATIAPTAAALEYASGRAPQSGTPAEPGHPRSPHGNLGRTVSAGPAKRGSGPGRIGGAASGRDSGPGRGSDSGSDLSSGGGRPGSGSGDGSGSSGGSGDRGSQGFTGARDGGIARSQGSDSGLGSSSSGDSGLPSGDSGHPSSGSPGGSSPSSVPGGSSDGGGGGSGSSSGSPPSPESRPAGAPTTTGQSSRDLLPPTGSSPVPDH